MIKHFSELALFVGLLRLANGLPNASNVSVFNASNASCLCIFDVDRTLTGQQYLLGPTCPENQIQQGVKDTAYGGGLLTLSEVGQSLMNTSCTSCFVGVITAGDVSGPHSKERELLVQHLDHQGQLISQDWSGPSAGGEARRPCHPWDAQSMLVTGCADGSKQEAAKGMISWLSTKGINIQLSHVWHFDDRATNVKPFAGTGMNAREVSCATRDKSIGIGVCGAATQEIIREPGISLCATDDFLV